MKKTKMKIKTHCLTCFFTCVLLVVNATADVDSLPSWRGANKQAIIDYVNVVTDQSSAEYIPPVDRIASFDLDGTLWTEVPVVQIEVAAWLVKYFLPMNVQWKKEQPFRAVLKNNDLYFSKVDYEKTVLEIIRQTHGGPTMTQTIYKDAVTKFFTKAKNNNFGALFNSLYYQPMVELLAYLRANGFKTYIVSGSSVGFMGVFAEDLFGVIPRQVIGSRYANLVYRNDAIYRDRNIAFINDHANKPVGLQTVIGQKPVFAVGNVRSGGDIEMLAFSQSSDYKSIQFLVHHDDALRECAYEERPLNESLVMAKDNNWHVISMKNDWVTIFKDGIKRTNPGTACKESNRLDTHKMMLRPAF